MKIDENDKFFILFLSVLFGMLALVVLLALKFAPVRKVPEKFTNESGQTTEFFHCSEFEKWHKENNDIEVVCESTYGSYVMIVYKKKVKEEINLKFKDIELTDGIFKPC